jgi:hypothetical protein
MSRLRFALAGFTCCLLGLAGCAGNGPSAATDTTWFGKIQREVFNQSCLSGGCHNSQSQAGGLNLSDGVAYDQLVGVMPDNVVARQAGLERVQPFAPDASFILVKLTAPGDGEGSRMPLGAGALSAAQIDMIRNWIAAGASRTQPAPDVTVVPGSPTATLPPTATDTAPPLPTDTPVPPTATNTALPPPPSFTPTAAATAATPAATATPAGPTATASFTATATPAPSATATPDAAALFARIQSEIFTTTCAVPFCHDSATRSGNLILEEGKAFDQLVGVTPDNAAAVNAGLLRVAPGSPQNSFLIVKLEGPPSLDFGSRMPLSGLPLTAEQIQLVRDWISALQ